jgi:adenylate cyclase
MACRTFAAFDDNCHRCFDRRSCRFMNAASLLSRGMRLLTSPLGRLSERLGNRFYIGLAAAVIVLALWAIAGGHTGGMKHQAYDFLIKSRFNMPAVDPDLILIDIDEASLAAMAPEYGRWPWPRSVIAELTEGLARQRPAAIVFDIAFSDLDMDHPDADRYLRDVIARHRQTFSAMIRLNPGNDSLSELRLAQLPGVEPLGPHASPTATVAMVVPYFFDVLDDRRLGTNNLYTGDDGIARSYHVYRDAYGWRIYSLPANVVQALGGVLPQRADILLNWRGRPPSYPTVSFHSIYTDLLKQKGSRPADEFTGKVVVIGSTAPSLFDLKPTSVEKNHPGVEILLTALDNLKRGDYLTELPRWMYLLITIAALAALAVAFIYNVDPVWLYTLFTTMQTAFLGVTYLFLNYTTWFVDLTAPFTAVLVFFVVARFYRRVLVGRRNGHPLYSAALDTGRSSQVFLIACRLTSSDVKHRRHASNILQREAGRTRYGVPAARPFAGAPLVDGIYDDTLLLFWLVAPEHTRGALADLGDMLTRSLGILERHGGISQVRCALHSLRFTVDADGHWRHAAKAAVIDALVVAAQPGPEALVATRAFEEVRSTCAGEALPPVLAQASTR